jgi:hypothetical protein
MKFAWLFAWLLLIATLCWYGEHIGIDDALQNIDSNYLLVYGFLFAIVSLSTFKMMHNLWRGK